MEKRDCQNCVKSRVINKKPIVVLCPFLKDFEGGVAGKIAKICKHYAKREEPELTAGQKWAEFEYPVCSEAFRTNAAIAYDQGQADCKPEPAMTADEWIREKGSAKCFVRDYIRLNKGKVIP
tara:strand:- start:56 stop:421 length:366 start_codon:yes stop_codon:yes gene_type:complete